MAFFTAIGTISNDIVRRETKNGVVATFRLETGAPRGRKLWIDIECWGHLAGVIARYGSIGRDVAVAGRLVQWAWRSSTEGDLRKRIAVRALDVDLLDEAVVRSHRLPNHITATGRIGTSQVIDSPARNDEIRFCVRSGRARAKTGALDLEVRMWLPPGVEGPVACAGSAAIIDGSMEWDRPLGSLVLATSPPKLRLLPSRGEGGCH